MTLTNAIRTATSALASSSQQVSVLSRNISGVGNPDYARRDPTTNIALYGQTRVETQRQIDRALYTNSITARANAEMHGAVADGLERLARIQDLEDYSLSALGQLQDLRTAVEMAAAAPGNNSALSSLVEQARGVASTISGSYGDVLSMRADADAAINASVDRLNTLLGEFKELNDEIVTGTRTGQDVFDAMDMRDTVINQISEEIGISVLPRENNDLVLVASNGVIVFETQPRSVSFEPNAVYGPNTTGNALYLDGIPVSGPNASLPIDSGRIAGNLQLRDDILANQQRQLDEISRGLVEMFAEHDQTGGGKPTLAGLFTWAGGPAVPASGVLEPGIALSLAINPAVDASAGGDAARLRDGVANGDADYLYNTGGGVGFSDRLHSLVDKFSETMSFDAAAGLNTSTNLLEYTSASLNGLSDMRQSATNTATYREELAVRYKEALQSETGANLDHEMSRLLEVERAYQASAKVLATVDELYATLFNVV